MRKHHWHISAWVLGAFLVGYAYAYVAASTTDSVQIAGCQALTGAVTTGRVLPPSVSEPGKPAVFCDLGVHFPVLRSYYSVFIYGVPDQGEQDSILGAIRGLPGPGRSHKILVQFFAKENWKAWSDPSTGRSGGSRGPEAPIRKVWID